MVDREAIQGYRAPQFLYIYALSCYQAKYLEEVESGYALQGGILRGESLQPSSMLRSAYLWRSI